MTVDPGNELKEEIKMLIMETLGIQDVKPEDIDNEESLFGGKNALTLDSVDGIEIIMAIQRKYQIRITDQHIARHVIQSINNIAEFVSREKTRN
jgi:acyl carrier protein